MTQIRVNDLAGNRSLGSIEPFQLWAGKGQIKTAVFDTKGVVFAKYEVVALANDGKTIIKFDPEATEADGSIAEATRAYGFVTQPVTASDVTAGIYYAGTPNHEALVWPQALTEFADRRAAFLNGHPKNEITIERQMGF